MVKWEKVSDILNIILLVWAVLNIYCFIAHTGLSILRGSFILFSIVICYIMFLFNWTIMDKSNPQSLIHFAANDENIRLTLRILLFFVAVVSIGISGYGAVLIYIILLLINGATYPTKYSVFKLSKERDTKSLIIAIIMLWFICTVILWYW
ncbi:MAG: hypothetical protein Q4P18_00380 [Methanobrevibacter sp.]|uniref:hypothetical protein n=1 Tax=Methanobrevibacter sp. TaxID=66852 RepID=UPI0026E06858|nr:hypothetical protein [Methanobrevibacter sp.]MDO5847979.1 hypothetical protein [Methanobrevibacter sp.]